MNPEMYSHHHVRIVYDADRITEPNDGLLRVSYWQQQQAVTGHARGRGQAVFIETPFGQAVLREYRRGGFPARFIKDRYLYLGLERSRPVREFRLLARLFVDGFPVPAPLAASCERQGWTYRGALMTQRLPGVTTLADFLLAATGPEAVLHKAGEVLRTFHAGGVDHADLNVRNILVSAKCDQIYLVDFDRSTYRPGHRVDGENNMKRLERSFQKLNAAGAASAWSALLRGYHGQS